jgi:hypothetical protein
LLQTKGVLTGAEVRDIASTLRVVFAQRAGRQDHSRRFANPDPFP